MEREGLIDERIRRAEEIYNKRNGITTPKESKKKRNPIKKLIMQIFICFIIYSIFFIVNNRTYIFSEQFLNNTKEIFMKNTSINEIYNNLKNGILNNLSTDNAENVNNNNESTENENNANIQAEGGTSNNEKVNQNDENIGGAEEEIDVSNNENKSDEDADVAYIKQNISFINPIEGKITSTFGWRTPTTASVPKYHTGLDIAAETGTVIKSSTDGEVVLASSEGDYGKHLEIQIGEVLVIYAHCNKLYKSQGEKVEQGQEIAEVGSTGNSTGPHLHFEIRRGNRKIDPQLILNI